MQLTPTSTTTSPDAQRDAVSAQVRDPLWIIARQWQTGGFQADDAGTPVRVAIRRATVPLLHDGVPLAAVQPLVEAEPPRQVGDLDNGTVVVLAMELARMLVDEGVPTAFAALTTAFGFEPAGAGPAVRPFVRRVPDVRTLHPALSSALGIRGDGAGTLPPIPGLDAALVTGTERVCRSWLGSLADRVAPAGAGSGHAPATWDPERLEYRFRLSAGLPSGSVDLVAPEYHGTGVDWYTLDRTPPDASAATPSPAEQVAATPVPVSYPGMPRPRFWELEDGAVNLNALRSDDNPGHGVLVSFVHQFANDWFLVPLEVEAGVTIITECSVTDTFGRTTEVLPVAVVDGGRGPWRLWDLTCPGPPGDTATGMRLLVPPTPRPLEGEPLEDVLLVRDELANLAWLVERTTTDADGRQVDRYQRHLALRPADPPPAAAGSVATYLLGTPIPDYWYPLVAVTGTDGRALLAPANVPPGAGGLGDSGVRGTIVRHTADSVLADEEVPREGVHIVRRDRLLPGAGRATVWRTRVKEPGLGEASSGLRFDVIR